jgi:L-asparaginase
VDVDGATFWRAPGRAHTERSEFRLRHLEQLPRVDIAYAYVGADGTAIDAFVSAGAQGLVLAGFPYSGIGSPQQRSALRAAAARGVSVVLASRGRGGRMPPQQEDAGWIRAHDLSAQKARVLLGLALAAGVGGAELQDRFDRY